MEHDVLLEMKNISKEFPGVKALDNVSLTVRRGTVHALMGENGAGKSTLMKCLFGMYVKDGGSISLEGKEINFKNSKEALENGVAMVHQELNQALKRSVMDNIWLGRYPKKGPMVDEKKMYDDTKALFDKLEIDVDPKRVVHTSPERLEDAPKTFIIMYPTARDATESIAITASPLIFEFLPVRRIRIAQRIVAGSVNCT